MSYLMIACAKASGISDPAGVGVQFEKVLYKKNWRAWIRLKPDEHVNKQKLAPICRQTRG
jgi:hypothetical protein